MADCPFDKLATDVTEFEVFGKRVYLSAIKDLYTEMIESYEISFSPNLNIALSPLKQIVNHAIPEGTFIHSDQGSLYASKYFRDILMENNFIQSMFRKGTPIDNAPMESFFAILKSELIYNRLIKFKSLQHFLEELKDYIDYYNKVRIQKRLGYLSPMAYKRKYYSSKYLSIVNAEIKMTENAGEY